MGIVLEVEWLCAMEQEAELRVNRAGEGWVTDDGNYARSHEFSHELFWKIKKLADDDVEATVRRVAR